MPRRDGEDGAGLFPPAPDEDMRLSMEKDEIFPPPPPAGVGREAVGCCGEAGPPPRYGELRSPALPSESVLRRCSVLRRRFLAGETPLAGS